MNKLRLTRQLILVYGVVLLVTILIFSIILSSWLRSIYKNIHFDKLTSTTNHYVELLSKGFEPDDLFKDDDVEYIIWDVRTNPRTEHFSSGVNTLLGTVQPNDIFSNIEKELQTGDFSTTLHIRTNYIYYADKTDDGNFYIFSISDLNVVNDVRQTITYQILILFFIILSCGMIVIAIWSNSQLTRIKNIGSHVKLLPDTSYKKSYIDNGSDEISQLSLDIEELRQKIFKNEETKREIIQNLSHDIKTPLAVIRSYAEAIYDEVEVTASSKLIIKQTELLETKVNKLLTLNRLSYLEKNRNFDYVKMKKIVVLIVENLKYISDITFITDLDDTVFLGYYDNLYTVLENIISNALRYAKTKIVITLKNSVLTIYNDGEQIDAKFLDAQFKPYEKGSSGVFGVGMSIVRQTLDFFNLLLIVENCEVGVNFIIKDPNPLKKVVNIDDSEKED